MKLSTVARTPYKSRGDGILTIEVLRELKRDRLAR